MMTIGVLVGSILVVLVAGVQGIRYCNILAPFAAMVCVVLTIFVGLPAARSIDAELEKENKVTSSDLKNVSPETAASLKADGIHPLSLYGMLRTVRDDMHQIRVNTEKGNDRPDEY